MHAEKWENEKAPTPRALLRFIAMEHTTFREPRWVSALRSDIRSGCASAGESGRGLPQSKTSRNPRGACGVAKRRGVRESAAAWPRPRPGKVTQMTLESHTDTVRRGTSTHCNPRFAISHVASDGGAGEGGNLVGLAVSVCLVQFLFAWAGRSRLSRRVRRCFISAISASFSLSFSFRPWMAASSTPSNSRVVMLLSSRPG